MAPIVHGLESEYSDQIKFIYLDIDDPNTEEFKRALGYRYQPNFYLIDGDGNVIQQWLGAVSPQDLRSAFDTAINN